MTEQDDLGILDNSNSLEKSSLPDIKEKTMIDIDSLNKEQVLSIYRKFKIPINTNNLIELRKKLKSLGTLYSGGENE
jgi:hypothetical protein